MNHRLPLCPSLALRACVVIALALFATTLNAAERPNILWLTTEDIGPHLGCYGDTYADTPNVDKFASHALRYSHAWSNAPVCAPARTTIITGMYAPSIGAEHMRSKVTLPPDIRLYPEYLREAGYFCVNPGKTDYNLEGLGQVWDDVDEPRMWDELKDHQPFMAVLNYMDTHESRVRRRPLVGNHDPAKAPLPAYHPDVKEVREDWAQYYNNITRMDGWVAEQLAKLDEMGLADDTIVFFYGDHGAGMPRSKRFCYNSGLQVPLLVYVPEKFRALAGPDYQPGGVSDRLVSFVDLAPTVLSLAGATIPKHMQGGAFMGQTIAPPPKYLYGYRGRMDERIDLTRSVTDGRYVYIRNYMPHLPLGQHVEYMFGAPSTQKWKELFDAGKLNEVQSAFWKPKSPEELYDLESDPDEVHNLADDPTHAAKLAELRQAHHDWIFEIRDLGFLPEDELHTRPSAGMAPYTFGHDDTLYPLKKIYAMADAASRSDKDTIPTLISGITDDDSAVRYWAVLGLLMHGEAGLNALNEIPVEVAIPESDAFDVVSGEILVAHGVDQERDIGLEMLLSLVDSDSKNAYIAIAALNAIDRLGAKTDPIREELAKIRRPEKWEGGEPSYAVDRLLKRVTAPPEDR